MDDDPDRFLPRAVLQGFGWAGAPVRCESVPGGHIHRNFLVTCPGARYVVQAVNDRVFSPVAVVLSNVERLTTHLRAGGRRAPELVETTAGALSLQDTAGATWRCFHFLEGTTPYPSRAGPQDAFAAGAAFADYVTALADFPDPPPQMSIERFHDLRHRLAALEVVTADDPVGRCSRVVDEIDRTGRLARRVGDALEAVERRVGPAQRRIVHNDAKVANLRIDSDGGGGACVIDLDTTMTGLLRYDVGELVRTATTHAVEDAGPGDAVDYDLDLLDAVLAGYVSGAAPLTEADVRTFALAGPEMAAENAVRFLTDHLAGDRYYPVDRPGQNLDRCRTQRRLAEMMLARHDETDARVTGATRTPGAATRSRSTSGVAAGTVS